MAEHGFSTLSTDELLAHLAGRQRPCWLVHATDLVSFRDGHIPGALAQPDLEVLRRLGAASMIVVYGEDEQARAAPLVATALRGSGVEVAWYAGGLTAWRRAGLPVEHSG